MNIGSLYERVTVYTPTSSSIDQYQQVIPTYSTASFWSNVTRERGHETDTKGIKYTYARYEFVIRNYGDVVDEHTILVHRNIAYNPVMIELVPWSKRRYLKIVGERRPGGIPPFPTPPPTPTPCPTWTPTPTPTPT
jgi:hypothetical protein